MAKEDESASIKCVFVPVFGDPIEVQKAINPGCEYSYVYVKNSDSNWECKYAVDLIIF